MPNKVQEEVPNNIPDKVPDKLRVKYPALSDAAWEVYRIAAQVPHASAAEMGEVLGISDRMVRKHIASLREAGLIERVGSNKTGYWKVLKKLKGDK